MATNQPPLFAMFVEARYTAPAGGTLRTQWVLFPPGKGEYGASSLHEGRACYMTRVFGVDGKKAKWKFEALPAKAAEEQLLKRIDEHEPSIDLWPHLVPLVALGWTGVGLAMTYRTVVLWRAGRDDEGGDPPAPPTPHDT